MFAKLQGGNFCKKVKIAKLSITAFFVSRAVQRGLTKGNVIVANRLQRGLTG